MKQFTQAEKLYSVLAKVAEYLVQRIAKKEQQQKVPTSKVDRHNGNTQYNRVK
jgi:hypothetical protein